MTLKPQQVVRTKIPLKCEKGPISPQTRAIVLSLVENGRVRVKVADPRFPDLSGSKFESTVGAFVQTHRGRPKKEK